jgi:hypothetical protein
MQTVEESGAREESLFILFGGRYAANYRRFEQPSQKIFLQIEEEFKSF